MAGCETICAIEASGKERVAGGRGNECEREEMWSCDVVEGRKPNAECLDETPICCHLCIIGQVTSSTLAIYFLPEGTALERQSLHF